MNVLNRNVALCVYFMERCICMYISIHFIYDISNIIKYIIYTRHPQYTHTYSIYKCSYYLVHFALSGVYISYKSVVNVLIVFI